MGSISLSRVSRFGLRVFEPQLVLSLGSRAVSILLLLGVSVLSARQLGPEGRGRYFLIVSYAQIAAQVGTFGLHSANTFFSANRHHRATPLLVQSLVFSGLIAPACAVALAVGFGWPELLTGAQRSASSLGPVGFLAAAQAPFVAAFLLVSNTALALGRVALFNWLILANAVASLVAAVLVALAGGDVAAFALASTIAAAASVVLAFRCVTGGFSHPVGLNRRYFTVTVRYGVRAFLATAAAFALARTAAIALQYTGQMKEVGMLSVSQQFIDALSLVPSTIASLVFPQLIRTVDAAERWRLTKSALKRTMIALVLASLVVVISIRLVIDFLYTPAYDEASLLVIYGLPAVFFLGAASAISQYLSAGGFPWSQVAVWCCALPVWIAGSVFSARIGGAAGLMIGQSVLYAAISVGLILLAMRRLTREQRR